MGGEPSITFEADEDGVGVLTLNRPERLNAFSQDMADLWREVLIDAAQNPAVKVIVVTGAGRAFCAGGDIKEMLKFVDTKTSAFKEFLWEHVQRIPLALAEIDKPVIAALNGTARGAGLDMALMCDLRIAAQSAVFAESYIHMGVIAGDGGTYYLPRLIGTARALELFWTGRDVDAHEAERIGFVNRVVPDGEALSATVDLGRQIARQPQMAVRAYKRATYQSESMSLAAHLDMVSSHMAMLQGTEGHQSRLRAFMDDRKEKRK